MNISSPDKKTQRISFMLATIAGTGLLGLFGIAGFAIHKDFQVKASGSLMDAFRFDFEGSPSPSPKKDALSPVPTVEPQVKE